LGIEWPIASPILSDKDRQNISFKKLKEILKTKV